jgi:uncharacterized protein (DUF169 family)
MSLATLSSLLTKHLGLKSTPVGVQPAAAAPAGVSTFSGKVPSACSLWRLAEKGTFFAPADAHHNCPIGTYTMGLPITDGVGQMLNAFITHMSGVAYLDPAEVARIPRYDGAQAGYVYGPLADFTAAPTLAVLWAGARQLMLLEEALGDIAWTSARAQVTGRPACAALAIAGNAGRASASVGCAGMRTFTEVADDLALVAISGGLLADLEAKLLRTVEANDKMVAFYLAHKANFPALATHAI